MGWLSSIFRPQKAEGTTDVQTDQETSLDNLILLLERKTQEKNSAFEGDLKSYHRKMTESIQEFSKALSELLTAPGPEKIDEALMKVARSYCSSMDKSFNETRIEFEKGVNYTMEEFSNYFRSCSSSVSRAEVSVAKYVNPMKEIFPKEMRNLLKKSESMNGAMEEIKSGLDKKALETKPISDSLNMSNEMRSHMGKLNEVALQVAEAKSNLAVLESKKIDLEQSVSDFLGGDQWAQHQAKLAEISALGKRRDGIRTFVVHSVVPLDRSMRKLKKIRSDLGKKIDDEELFDLYITDPLEAFLRDTNQKVLNRTVLQIKDIFEKISPDPDSKKDQKTMENILFLESGEIMGKARSDYDEMDGVISKLQAELNVIGAKETKSRLDEDLKATINGIPDAKTRVEKTESLFSKASDRKAELFDQLKAAAAKALGDQIRIQQLN